MARAPDEGPPSFHPCGAGDQQPTGPPPAGQVGMLMGMQLTEVVETANARSTANKTFFPLIMS